MACAMFDVYAKVCPDTPHISGTEMNPSLRPGFKKVMITSESTYPVVTPGYYSKPNLRSLIWM